MLTHQSSGGRLWTPLLPPDATVLREGWLVKRAVSATVWKNWRKRWLVLRAGTISWHRVETREDAAGSMALKDAVVILQSEVLVSIRDSGGRELVLHTGSLCILPHVTPFQNVIRQLVILLC